MADVSDTELRQNLAKYMDAVCDSRAPLRVIRQNAGSVIMLAEADYEGLMETLHLLGSPATAARLVRSIASADAGRLTERELV
jgi:antitoxin YefM